MIVDHYLAPLVRIIGGISGLPMTPEWSRDQLPLVQVCPPSAAIAALTDYDSALTVPCNTSALPFNVFSMCLAFPSYHDTWPAVVLGEEKMTILMS